MIFSRSQRSLVFLALLFCGMIVTSHSADAAPQETTVSAPWTKPRKLSDFQALLQHSPFSLASAEEASPLSDRYALTGIMTIDGEDEVFVLDRNDQSRELLTKKPNEKGMTLITILPQEDPNKLKATVSIGGETGTISELELSTNKPTMGPQHFPPSKGNYYPPNSHLPPSKNNNSYSSYPPPSYSPSSPSMGHPPRQPYSGSFNSQGPTGAPSNNSSHVIKRPPIPSNSGNNNFDDFDD